MKTKINNKVNLLDTHYLSSNRTVDVMLVEDDMNGYQTAMYVYNYQGTNFRVFRHLHDLLDFLYDDRAKPIAEFGTDDEVEDFLTKFDTGG